MITILAEKPSVAREIARIVGAMRREEGYFTGNGYYVTWALGHLVQLAMPDGYGVKGFRRDSLPVIPERFELIPRQVKTDKGCKADAAAVKQIKVITKLWNDSEGIIVATDCAREGELIFRYLYAYIGCTLPFQRLWISSLTDAAIRKGLKKLKDGREYDNLYQAAKARSELLVFSGGLGPTADDLTKETVARCFDDTLYLEPSILENIQAYFAATGRHMPPHNEKQAMVPEKGGWFENHNGTAPAVWFQKNGKRAVLLPGPPSELKPLWTEQVWPFLSDGTQRVLHSLTLRITGIGESHVEEQVGHLFENENPTAAIYAKTGEVQIRITARAASHREGEAACRAYAEKFRAILGDVIYGEDANDLEHTLVQTLTEKKLTVATAESCTGGLVSQRITQVPGSSEVFGFGFCTYANEAKHKLLGVSEATLATVGAVSWQTAAQMALGAARVSGADIAVSLTGIAGPGGGTAEKPVGLVYVGAARGDEVYVAKLLLGNRDRQSIRIFYKFIGETQADAIRALPVDVSILKQSESLDNEPNSA